MQTKILLILTIMFTACAAAEFHVGANQEYSTISGAIGDSSDGDAIIIESGTYQECLNITKQLSIRSEEGAEVVISCSSSERAISVESRSAILNIAVTLDNSDYCSRSYGIYVGADGCSFEGVSVPKVVGCSSPDGGDFSARDSYGFFVNSRKNVFIKSEASMIYGGAGADREEYKRYSGNGSGAYGFYFSSESSENSLSGIIISKISGGNGGSDYPSHGGNGGPAYGIYFDILSEKNSADSCFIGNVTGGNGGKGVNYNGWSFSENPFDGGSGGVSYGILSNSDNQITGCDILSIFGGNGGGSSMDYGYSGENGDGGLSAGISSKAALSEISVKNVLGGESGKGCSRLEPSSCNNDMKDGDSYGIISRGDVSSSSVFNVTSRRKSGNGKSSCLKAAGSMKITGSSLDACRDYGIFSTAYAEAIDTEYENATASDGGYVKIFYNTVFSVSDGEGKPLESQVKIFGEGISLKTDLHGFSEPVLLESAFISEDISYARNYSAVISKQYYYENSTAFVSQNIVSVTLFRGIPLLISDMPPYFSGNYSVNLTNAGIAPAFNVTVNLNGTAWLFDLHPNESKTLTLEKFGRLGVYNISISAISSEASLEKSATAVFYGRSESSSIDVDCTSEVTFRQSKTVSLAFGGELLPYRVNLSDGGCNAISLVPAQGLNMTCSSSAEESAPFIGWVADHFSETGKIKIFGRYSVPEHSQSSVVGNCVLFNGYAETTIVSEVAVALAAAQKCGEYSGCLSVSVSSEFSYGVKSELELDVSGFKKFSLSNANYTVSGGKARISLSSLNRALNVSYEPRTSGGGGGGGSSYVAPKKNVSVQNYSEAKVLPAHDEEKSELPVFNFRQDSRYVTVSVENSSNFSCEARMDYGTLRKLSGNGSDKNISLSASSGNHSVYAVCFSGTEVFNSTFFFSIMPEKPAIKATAMAAQSIPDPWPAAAVFAVMCAALGAFRLRRRIG